MKNIPLISILIPAFNHEDYVEVGLKSIIDQDYLNLEIIVINDGSTDHTGKIARKTLEQSSRSYTIITQENMGAHQAINRGIQEAKGDYITILNSDDYFLPGRLKIMVEALQTSQKRFAFSEIVHIDANGDPHPYQEDYLRLVNGIERFPTGSFEFLRSNLAVTTGNFFFHRSLVEEIGEFSPYITSHDWDFLMRVLLVEEPLFVRVPLLAYRIHDQGTLQANLQLVDHEVDDIMLNYLEQVGHVKNSLAPGPVWGEYWAFFCKNYLERISAYPKMSLLLEKFNLDFSSLNKGVDLDLTPLNLKNLIPISHKKNKQKPHILFILPWLVMGGAERFTLNLMDQLREHGWQLSIICTSPSENTWRDEFEKRTGTVFILPDLLPVRDYLRFIRTWIEMNEIDAMLLQGSVEGYRFFPALRQLFPTLLIMDYLHFVTQDWMDGGFPRLSQIYGDGLDFSVVSCDQVKQWMIREGVPEARIKVYPIGVDEQRWKPDAEARANIRKKLGIDEPEILIIYAARLEPQKQPLIFAQTMFLLKQKGASFRAVVAGDGSLRSELEETLKQLDLEQDVLMLGAVPETEMPELLAAGDLFFLPSENEGVSSAIYEAMACALPVVGADVGGQAELVTTQCGFLLSGKSKEEQPNVYAEVLLSFVKDQTRLSDMGRVSRKRIIEQFTLNQMGNQFITLLTLGNQNRNKVTISQPNSILETQHAVEYLQARYEWQKANRNLETVSKQYRDFMEIYAEFIPPQPPSHWFYLWIRQLFLPLFKYIKSGFLGKGLYFFQRILQKKWNNYE